MYVFVGSIHEAAPLHESWGHSVKNLFFNDPFGPPPPFPQLNGYAKHENNNLLQSDIITE